MIITVTLNPAVDKTIELGTFQIGSVNRVIKVREDAGGKGINVSKMIHTIGGETIATGIVGGTTGRFIEEQMDHYRVPHLFVQSADKTRTNMKMIDLYHQTYTDINEPGSTPEEEQLNLLAQKIFSIAKPGDMLILSGSIPAGSPRRLYAQWIEKANAFGLLTILDTDGEGLALGIEAKPTIIKPNIYELECLLGKNLSVPEDILYEARQILKKGVKHVVVSMAERGCIWVSENEAHWAKGLQVNVRSTVGAGDALVGAMACALSGNLNREESLKLMVGAATATIEREGTVMGDLDKIRYFENKVTVMHLNQADQVLA